MYRSNRLGAAQLRTPAEAFFEDEFLDVEEKETENRGHIFIERWTPFSFTSSTKPLEFSNFCPKKL